jgi:hypothetical protein
VNALVSKFIFSSPSCVIDFQHLSSGILALHLHRNTINRRNANIVTVINIFGAFRVRQRLLSRWDPGGSIGVENLLHSSMQMVAYIPVVPWVSLRLRWLENFGI